MTKKRLKTLEELELVAIEIVKKVELQKQRTENLREMASLARKNQKGSDEFLKLEKQIRQPIVTDFGKEIDKLCKIVEKLKKV